MRAFILAGGFATRLWPLTESRAKPLLPVAGKPLLTHIIQKLPKDMAVTVSTNAVFGDDMRAWATDKKNVEILIEDSGHEGEKLGALGAIARWIVQENIADDILVVAGDNYFGLDIADFVSRFTDHPLVAAHDIGDLSRAKQFGIVIAGEAQNGLATVTGFQEKPQHPTSTLASTGLCVIPKNQTSTLVEYAAQHPDNLGGIFEEFLRRKTPVSCRIFTETWVDIGSFGSYLRLHRELVGEKPLIHPSADVQTTDVTGSVDIGAGCTVTESRVKDCIVFQNTRIDDCVLTDCIVDEDCMLQGVDLRGQMLRKGTRLVRKNNQ